MNRRVIAAVSDMIFASKIRGTGEQSNVSVAFARSEDSLFDAAKNEVPSLIILDLHLTQLDPFALAARLKADEQLSTVTLIGFFSHVQTELQARAVEAGFDHVLPRSAFTKHLPEILRGEF